MADITIPIDAARKLTASKDARACLLYIRILCGGEANERAVAAELGWSAAEYRAAEARLESLGLLPRKPLEPADDPVVYAPAEISRSVEGDPEFAETLRYTQTRLGRNLSTTDISRLLGIYRRTGLPAGALMLLVSYCDARVKRKSGETARVSMVQIEREAFRWAREGVATEAEAEAHVRRLEQREERSTRLARMLQINGRAPTTTERSYLEKWSELPLDDDAIYAAYDRTMINTGALKWSYMNRILEDWAANGVPGEQKKPQQQASAAKPKPKTSGGGKPAARAADSERLRRLRELEEKNRNK